MFKNKVFVNKFYLGSVRVSIHTQHYVDSRVCCVCNDTKYNTYKNAKYSSYHAERNASKCFLLYLFKLIYTPTCRL